eukprot:TRINITY_DN919_c0_g1_i2.p1 TRINITY_DN919_c0_g1~~TRINITY_DN919_c0_g1_i2.p1  ORF type:complete len:491 (-),score=115.15 TRINITY_DN919_c0_g1_i2:263-1630(-)
MAAAEKAFNVFAHDTTALAAEGTQSVESMLVSGMQGMLQADPSYTLFQYKDIGAWAIFSGVFVSLIIFDNCVLNRSTEALTLGKALKYTLFWIMTACSFCVWVYFYFGKEQAFMWMSGYMLEWMLSFDNLFVFHLIFSVYGTPEHLKHRPLYIGICGAVFFRLIFLFIGEYLMHAMVFMHIIFGSFLIWTGYKTLAADDDDEDPSQNVVVQWLQAKVPFVDMYDKSGSFFVQVPVNEKGELDIPAGQANLMTPMNIEVAPETNEDDDGPTKGSYGTMNFEKLSTNLKKDKLSGVKEWRTKATMLFLVVMCLEISDVVFAVDSVSAIVAQVPNLFLAYTSAVFAMLGLRATFFIIDVLVHMFSLLKYGVAVVLMFIGAKLCLSHVIHIPAAVVCLVLVSSIALSMVASVVQEEFEKKADGEEFDDVKERVEKVCHEHQERTPFASPMPQAREVAIY